MTVTQPIRSILSRIVRSSLIAGTLALGACANGGNNLDLGLGLGSPQKPETKLAGGTDLGRAVTYWGRQYAKKPQDKKAALNYAKNLKAAGHSKQAFRVLQHASSVHGNDREIASEYGRLALDHGQVALANKLLGLADDHSSPDWRIVSGRGAALAKMGKYGDAVKMFERAHKLAPSNPTVLNNLAMAHAGNGNLHAAERLLRDASQNPMAKEKVQKNLALVLKLQGRNAEAARLTASKPISTASITRSVKPAATPKRSAALQKKRRAVSKRSRSRVSSSALAIRKSLPPATAPELSPIVARRTMQ